MIIYISGPITYNYDYEQDFAEAEQYLFERYSFEDILTILNPVRFSKAVVGNPLSYNDYLAIDTHLISLCSHIYFLKNWEDSYGCQVEYLTALKHNLTMLFQE